jgi:hypothetical protein
MFHKLKIRPAVDKFYPFLLIICTIHYKFVRHEDSILMLLGKYLAEITNHFVFLIVMACLLLFVMRQGSGMKGF